MREEGRTIGISIRDLFKLIKKEIRHKKYQ